MQTRPVRPAVALYIMSHITLADRKEVALGVASAVSLSCGTEAKCAIDSYLTVDDLGYCARRAQREGLASESAEHTQCYRVLHFWQVEYARARKSTSGS